MHNDNNSRMLCRIICISYRIFKNVFILSLHALKIVQINLVNENMVCVCVCFLFLGSIMFHVRRRPADYHPRKRKKKPTHKWNQQNSTSEMLEYRYEDGLDRLPFFLELNAG